MWEILKVMGMPDHLNFLLRNLYAGQETVVRTGLLNGGVEEESWVSLGLQGDAASHPKGNQSWMFTGRTDAEAKTPILGHLMQRADSFDKSLMLVKFEGRRRRGWQRMRWLDGIVNSRDMNMCGLQVDDGQGGLLCCHSWAHKSWTWLSNWTELKLMNIVSDFFPLFLLVFFGFAFDGQDFLFP